MDVIRYDYTGALLENGGLTQSEWSAVRPALENARDIVLGEDLAQFRGEAEIPAEKQPLDAGFLEMPERLLAEHQAAGPASELGRILSTAEQMQQRVDRVVLLGIGGSYMGARALMEGLCPPYFNELSRTARGGKPRLYFEGNNVDNDATQGLLDLLGGNSKSGAAASGVDESWAIVVISKSGGTLETASALRQFLAALRVSRGGKPDGNENIADYFVPVTGGSGKLFELSQALGAHDIFNVPDGVGGRFSIFSAVGLVPAAMLGIDIVALLRGAAAMNEHFRQAPVGGNAVLDYVGVSHQMETLHGANTRVFSVWSKSLESVGLWYDQLLAESLGKEEKGALPLTVVNTRDLHSRAQQHQEGRRDKLITNLIVDRWRREPLPIGASSFNQDQLNDLADKTLPDLMSAAIKGTNKAYASDNRPTTDLHLPEVNAFYLGQLFQMLMLATVVEGRIMGVNPYGQPGVEQYKQHMNAFLRG